MLPPVPLRLTIDLDALAANWRWFARQSGSAACGAAVKADGYGIGATQVAKRLAREGCRDFFVATWREAAELMPLDPDLNLRVLHGILPGDMEIALASKAVPVLISAAQIARWRAAAPGRSCDVMIDTGMNRLGLAPDEVPSLNGLAIDTLHSHLACADEPNHPMNERQRSLFAELASQVSAKRRALANSAGICLGPTYQFDLTRPGLGLYGGTPHPLAEGRIAQVVRAEAQVVQIRCLRAGDSVGYGAAFVAEQPMRVGVLNLGYADGYLRGFSGTGRALAGDTVCPVIGRVSMDLTAIDASRTDLSEGDWVEIDLDLPAAATASGLSQYELLTSLGRRYHRRYL